MEKRKELYRGKTKAIFATDDKDVVILQNFDALTKFDDPSQTKQMEGKSVHATNTTCNVFRLLQAAGIPVAFKEQVSTTEFAAYKCQMIPLEVIARRYAVGSYLKRFPGLAALAGQTPKRFHRLVFEIFLKTTGKIVKSFDGEEIGEVSIEDPLIEVNDLLPGNMFLLRDPKLPVWENGSELKSSFEASNFFPYRLPEVDFLTEIEKITRNVFLLLEGAWAQLGFRLIDFKIEFGIDSDKRLVVADVIDNDSWRLRTSNWEEVSKQCFRDNAQMSEIADKYEMVSKLTNNFRLPKQEIVIWRGSKNDPGLDISLPIGSSMTCGDIIISGHKSPSICLETLEDILSEHPEGGVIIAMVGMSNGLGPILAARTSWPVITVPLTANENAVDIFSSLNVPSQVPLLTVLSQKNAFLAALNILALKNPYAYMIRQYEIEKLDI